MEEIYVMNSIYNEKSKPRGKSKTWLDFWEEKKSTNAESCSRIKCDNNADIGAKVSLIGSSKEYVVPLCKECSKLPAKFLVEKKKLVKLDYSHVFNRFTTMLI
jgi:hypothetical protein